MFGADIIPNGNGLVGDKKVANILDDLGDRVHKKDFGGGLGSFGDHGDGINDWNCIEEGLDADVPNGSDVAISDVDGTE